MNPQIKQKWLTALRSGEYKQGKGALRRYDNFCCLGVLCDIYLKENNLEWEKLDDGVYDMFNNHRKEILPTYVCVWAGISIGDTNPEINKTPLSKLNDYPINTNFIEIANLIEKHL